MSYFLFAFSLYLFGVIEILTIAVSSDSDKMKQFLMANRWRSWLLLYKMYIKKSKNPDDYGA